MYSIDIDEILGAEKINLSDMLDAREKRASMHKRILSEYGMTLISFTLNIPGSVKKFPLAQKTFEEGVKLIAGRLEKNRISIAYEEDNISNTGYERYMAVDCGAGHVKKMMIDIEDGCSLGRVFDIDVFDPQGNGISRGDVGESRRACLLCGESSHACARSERHSKEELVRKTIDIMLEYFSRKFADTCSALACKALMYEVMTTPKPGLVDRDNNGSHRDMDIYTFIDSTSALTPHFRDYVLAGIEFCSDSPKRLFKRVRYIGMEAEDDMFRATDNVNTHKGLIFSLGVICVAMGYLFGNSRNVDVENILDITRDMTENVLDDFKGIDINTARTCGEKLYALYGITGIRGEASEGFPSVRDCGLPVMRKLVREGMSLNDAGALTLLNLIASVRDTNIISRADIQIQERVQTDIRKLIGDDIGSVSFKDIEDLNRRFIELNISPGGCADLLAVTFMLYFVENNI